MITGASNNSKYPTMSGNPSDYGKTFNLQSSKLNRTYLINIYTQQYEITYLIF